MSKERTVLLRTTSFSVEAGEAAVGARPATVASDDKQHWPPTCFEENQGTSPLLLPLRPELQRPASWVAGNKLFPARLRRM